MADENADRTKVLFGKEDYLFLTNDGNRTIDQVTGNVENRDDLHSGWRSIFECRLRDYATVSRRMLFVVAPMKEVVCSQYLPDAVKLSDARPVSTVISAAAEVGMPLIYPVDSLRSLSQTKCVYPKGDTHWTAVGAFHVYCLAMTALGISPEAESEFRFEEHFAPGDLSAKIGGKTVRILAQPLVQQSRVVLDNGVTGTGNLKVFENPTKSRTCIVFRDSYTNSLEVMLAQSFRKVVLVWQPNIDAGLVRAERPDFILNIMAERFLSSVPDDSGGPTNSEFVRRKQEGLATGILNN